MSTELFSQDCRNVAESLYSTKCRKIASYPCVLVQRMSSECPNKKSILGRDHRVAYYAPKLNTFRKFLSIDDSKCQNLEGFKLLGYKEYVFMYGGEFLIGRGSWNLNFWVYDTIRENWERKSVLPAPRRHFETCIVGSKVFIIGGIGKFRITQENLFWYDFKEDKWSQMIALPFYDRQLKCCSFSDKFFILSIKDKCGYFYAQNELGNWTWLTRQVVVEDEVLSREKVFGLLSYKNKLYIKGKKLIEFGLDGDKIVLLSIKNITNVEYDDLEVILCYDTIYTLYRNRNVDTTAYTLEKYNLETGDTEFISRDIEDIMEIDGERFQLNSNMKIFSFNHYSAVENNDVINNSFS
ncbi:hypothetical protein JTB14_022789 [Gonioctena quinquepunctata]|nr:hypothetical protein JTB14_022789 [Gonioctena quinquepunctata]